MNKGHLERLVSDEWRQELRDVILPNALDGIPLGGDVLEIGPGPGLTTDFLRFDVAHLTAIELDVTLAAALAARFTGTNVDVVHADATAMPFDDCCFTGAVSFSMLHHVPTAELQDRVFAEVARVLCPGGVLVVADSLASDALATFHEDDIYNPVEPDTVLDRLAAAGFVDADISVNGSRWSARARMPAS